jgi:glyoxylase-like metal-dependent hydrolase (beta-lactamase superfamily II)
MKEKTLRVSRSVQALKVPFEIPLPGGGRVPRFVYVYLVTGRADAMIDSGVAAAAGRILGTFGEAGRSPAGRLLLALTHAHPDHIGGARAVRDAADCTVAAHPAERAWIEDTDRQERERPVPGFRDLVGGSVPVDRLLQDGDRIDLGGGLELEVIHTPGHSPGSLSFFLRPGGALFCSDAIPQPGQMPIYEDAAASARSIRRLMSLEGVRVLLSSWDDPREGDEVRKSLQDGLACIRHIHGLVRRLASAADPADPLALCRQAVAELGLPPFAANPLAARTFAAHLQPGLEPEMFDP